MSNSDPSELSAPFLSLRARVAIGFTILFTGAFFVTFYFYYSFTHDRVMRQLRADMEHTLQGAARGVDTAELLTLYADGERNAAGFSDDLRYRNQLQWLETVHDIEPHAWLYTYVRGNQPDTRRIGAPIPNDNEVVFLVDLWVNYETSKATKFLEPYAASPWMIRSLEQGIVVQRPEPYTDYWGSWISAYAPLKDSAQKVVAGIGIDVELEYVRQIKQEIRDRMFQIFAIAYLVQLLLVYLLSGWLARRLRALTAMVDRLSQTPEPQSVQWKCGQFRDELDILARVFKDTIAQLQQRQRFLNTILEDQTESVCRFQVDGKLTFINKTYCQYVGKTRERVLAGNFMDLIESEDRDRAIAQLESLTPERPVCMFEHQLARSDFKRIWKQWTIRALFDDDNRLCEYQAVGRDISERKHAEAQLRYEALHDKLTGLPNRILFLTRLDRALQAYKRSPGRQFSVLFLDVDRFKLINDSLGHLTGNQFLMETAYRLRSCLRSTDTVARLGGDEFAILLEELHDSQEACECARRIQQELGQPFLLEDREVCITASIGIAHPHSRYGHADDMLRDADIAMYQSKRQRRGGFQVFVPQMHAHTVTWLDLEEDLRRALRREELQVYYQSIVSLQTEQLTGFEALVRWQPPHGLLISPAEFLPVAEETDLIVQIGWWVMREACNRIVGWQAELNWNPPLSIGVNLSQQQFTQPDLIYRLSEILEQTGLPPERLHLEIVEDIVMDNAELAIATLARLRQLQVQINIDDFGTGYSSLSRLQSFPIDALKIDRSFVNKMISNPESLEIVRAIVTLAHNLGLDAIAEGVETKEQVEQLRSLGCDYAQGYFYSRPLPDRVAKDYLDRMMDT
jgi:diguanylate cyclase (GGDEF)-like protein/PAS domain S-box-containing protein